MIEVIIPPAGSTPERAGRDFEFPARRSTNYRELIGWVGFRDVGETMMQTTWLNLLLIAAGGGLGAVCRYLAASAVNDWGSDFKPLGTMAVNVVGCFVVGLVMHLLVRAEATGSPAYYLLVTGVLGGFTTFSAFGYETLVLMQKRQQTDVLLNLGGNLGCGLLAVYLGQRTGAALWP